MLSIFFKLDEDRAKRDPSKLTTLCCPSMQLLRNIVIPTSLAFKSMDTGLVRLGLGFKNVPLIIKITVTKTQCQSMTIKIQF